MKMRTFIGLCAALAFAAGSTAVHAVKIVDRVGDDPAADDTMARASNTYAREMFTTTDTTDANEEGDTTTYYDIAETEILLSARADISANPGDTYLVTYVLDGMVFRDTASIVEPADNFTIAAGGQSGDKIVVFRMDATATAVTTLTLIVLDAQFAISAAGSGSVTRTVTNQSLAVLNILGVTGMMTHTASGIIKLGSGVKETSMANSPTATVEHSFRSFGGSAVATVGSLRVTHNDVVRQNNESGGEVSDLNQIIDNAVDGESTVDIMGDFSFATNAFLHGDDDCSADAGTDMEAIPAAPGLLKVEGTGEDMMVVGVDAQNVAAFAEMMYLCIAVNPDDEDGMRIPETGAYTAMGDYEGAVTDAAFDPEPVKQTLGRIKRDGTTVRFPYLTTREGYVQRIRIVNRGGAAKYTLDYASNAEAVAGTEEGVLEAGERKVLVVSDVVEITGSTTTAGTLIVEAEARTIDVATTVNTADGGIDTVVYPPPPPPPSN